MFSLPRRRREPFDENKAQIRHISELENNIMSALEQAVEELRSAIDAAAGRVNVTDFSAALAEERARYDALVAAEIDEDIQQDAALADARQATDSALAEIQAAADSLNGLTAQVNNLGAATEAPVEETPVEAEAPVVDETPAELPTEAPVEAPAEETPVEAAPVEAEAPAEAPVDTPVVDETPADAAPVPATGAEVDPTSTEAMRPAL